MKEIKSKKNKVKRLLGVICLLLMFIIGNVYPTYTFAQVNESEIESEETRETALEKDNGEREVRFPNKLDAKEPPSDNRGGDSQSDGINKGIPTVEGSAKAELIESVNNANREYPIHHGESTGDGSNKYFADARQFITFKTKSGKTFHLIINYDEEGQNVILLTEVSEDDLLNMVDAKEKPKEEVKKIEEVPLPTEATKEEPVKEEPKKKEESKGAGLYIFLGLLVMAVVGAGYYFKIFKKNQEESEDDEDYNELEDDYESEDSIEEPEETTEEEEQEEVDNMAIDAYEEEEDE
ncbi:MAG: CD1107 family mobile element protein [Lachnoanaerobaculum saburreum]